LKCPLYLGNEATVAISRHKISHWRWQYEWG
jgi:hypothetical protein